MQRLPSTLKAALRNYVEEANVRQTASHFFPEILTPEDQKRLERPNSSLHRLFDARNTVFHSGHKENLTLDDCKESLDVARELILIEHEQPEV